LVEQLDGKIKVNNEEGTSFLINFRELKYKERD
jgi:two-component sensor histidine kinase